MATACRSVSFVYHDDCIVGYEICGVGADAKVKAYYTGHGPRLDTIASRFMGQYATTVAREGAYQGCWTALSNTFHRLYG